MRELVQLGASDAEIVARLQVGAETVRPRVRNAHRKLSVARRNDLVFEPMLRGH